MAFTDEELSAIKPVIEKFIEQERPREEIRDKVDLSYKVEDQDLIIHEIRPRWDDPQQKIYPEIAKASWVRSRGVWKIYWRRGNLKWAKYDPKPEVGNLSIFLDEVRKDPMHVFWG